MPFAVRRRARRQSSDGPCSRLCTQQELESPGFQRWAAVLREPHMHLHRKLWEWCFITDVLHAEGLLAPGRRGLGFAVGHEPLVAYFASRGVRILATDLDLVTAVEAGWVGTNQHAASTRNLNDRALCDASEFERLVEFRELNMLELGDIDLGTFDFVWSSCAFEHLGTLDAGQHFVVDAMRYLRPGGLAVHTTEFNVQSNRATVREGETVIYRRRDIESLAADLRRRGHAISVDFTLGTMPFDDVVDLPPYSHDPHLKLHLKGYTSTSIGLAVRCGHPRQAR